MPPETVHVDTSDIDRMARDLHTFAQRGAPFAVRNALNSLAFQGQKLWRSEVEEAFILRNRFTVQSIRAQKAQGYSIEGMQSATYTIAGYLGDQEEGAQQQTEGAHGKPIPTSYAAGQRGANPRTKLVRAPNKMRRITLADRRQQFAKPKQRIAVSIRMAAKEGAKYVFLDLTRRKGIFRLVGGKSRPRLEMVWDLSKPVVRIPPTPTLEPALKKLEGFAPDIQRKALLDQLRRNRVFGY